MQTQHICCRSASPARPLAAPSARCRGCWRRAKRTACTAAANPSPEAAAVTAAGATAAPPLQVLALKEWAPTCAAIANGEQTVSYTTVDAWQLRRLAVMRPSPPSQEAGTKSCPGGSSNPASFSWGWPASPASRHLFAPPCPSFTPAPSTWEIQCRVHMFSLHLSDACRCCCVRAASRSPPSGQLPASSCSSPQASTQMPRWAGRLSEGGHGRAC